MSSETGSPTTFPTPFQVGACRIVLGAVGARANSTALHGSYSHTVSDGIYRDNDLRRAEAYLLNIGLLHEHDGHLEPTPLGVALYSATSEDLAHMLVIATLQAQPPLWLSAATADELREEFIPERELHTLHELGLDSEEREALLLAAGRRADPAAMARVGAAGEVEVVRVCQEALVLAGRSDLAEQVLHVSLISDQLGYDVKAPTPGTGPRHLEVKTCAGYGEELVVYLSRNEAEIGQHDVAWRLVVCRLVGPSATVVGWCTHADIKQMLPHDGEGHWASAKLSLKAHLLAPGVPLFDGDEPRGVPLLAKSERLEA